jgi:hypothetical protein
MKYYKILNKDEKHLGLQYKTGLNIDPIPFNPSGDCEEGGIYFAREDILAFLSYGPWLREISLPPDARVYENPDLPKKWKADKVVLGEREEIDAEVIERLINEEANIHVCNDEALRWASKNGHYEIVKLLIEYGADIHIYKDEVLTLASENGYYNVVKLLIEHGANVNATKDNRSLIYASGNGHYEIVKLLIKHGSDIRALNDYALRWASNNGHYNVVKLLIEHGANVHANNNEALRWASGNDHYEIVKLLIEYGADIRAMKRIK